MTTEAGSEAEVKKEPEKTEEQQGPPEQQTQTEPEPLQQEETQKEPQALGDTEAKESQASTENKKETNTVVSESEASEKPKESDLSNPQPAGTVKKEKEQPASKGISRFLPPWLKKQKSQSQVEPKESLPKEPTAKPLREQEGEEKDQAEKDQAEKDQAEKSPTQSPSSEQPDVKKEVEKEEEVVVTLPEDQHKQEQEEVKADEKEEKHSIGSADTQPAKEDRRDDSLEKETDLKEEEKNGAGEEKKVEEHIEKPEVITDKPPVKPPKKMKTVMCKVTMLDGTEYPCEVEKRAKGQILFFKVCEHLNLLEKDYFGLNYRDNTDQKCWLDPTKEIKRQIRNSPWQFAFNVKFYPPDPSQLTEDLTRYFLCLQLRQDIASGRLPCSFVTHSLLGSYTLQAELGDYDPEEHRHDYISDFQFAPSHTKEMEEKVVELHKTHRGLTPAQADLQFLENAKKLSMYGVDLHHAKDSEGVDIMLGVCANGLLIYKDRLRINRFAWPKILKISYKRSNFYIKIRPGETEQFESTIGFKLPNHRSAKRLWKVCVEHHTFFRLITPEQPPKAKFLTLGSKFRYSGRTQAQTRQASTLIDRPAPYFERTSSKRVSRSLDGVNIADQGLLPDSSGPALSDVTGKGDRENGKEAGTGLELSPESKSLEEEITTILLSKESFSTGFTGSFSTAKRAAEGSIAIVPAESLSLSLASQPAEKTPTRTDGSHPDSKDITESSDDKQKSEMEEQAEVEIEETVVIEEIRKTPKVKTGAQAPVSPEIPMPAEKEKEDRRVSRETSTSSDSHSESEEEAEYHPQVVNVSVDQIKEEPEEEDLQKESMPATEPPAEGAVSPPSSQLQEVVVEEETKELKDRQDEAYNGHEETEPVVEAIAAEEPKVNGDVSHTETEHMPQVICCSEPPVVKTEMVTISDTFAAQKTEISTKEVPIVHTETKTITYEAAQLDGSGEGEPGVLMTAQTITSESVCTTTTTHITKMVKGGLSETRIEKRIVITGDADIDHDQALAQAIKEAKEQHPDMSVTRVVVHKETELEEEGED
ncbi:band 4.1-like protein 2 isoform X8 [Amia ocellicauda]|uniref:band 4.1-like protein 2 isoform X8 n=1 Tax=Amia ocellicauda TaxID=2972642 RepID=UPI0034648B8B